MNINTRYFFRFTSVFGLLWLFVEPFGLFFSKIDFGWIDYIILIVISILISIIMIFRESSKEIVHKIASSDTTITIKIGDLFEQKEHLVIGLNDVFDTELGDIIKSTSVQGQFLSKIYDGDIKKLNEDIQSALIEFDNYKFIDNTKVRGKNERYPIGTTIVLGSARNRYFLTAYGKMNSDLHVTSTGDDVWKSLYQLWDVVRLNAHGGDVSIPLIGTDLARTNLPRMSTIMLIILSYTAASKQKMITNNLNIIIYPRDLDKIDIYELNNFLKSIRL
ncbi:macro domain-containing protein [Herpetosiphon llansteffanensis]